MSKIILGMSGGVDSAVCAYLLKQQGHDVHGVFMRNWDSAANNDILGNPNIENGICAEEQDWKDVVAIGEQLGISVQRVDFVKEYWDEVFQNLIEQYSIGRTPNPDILCNKYIKFGAFYDWVVKNIPDFDYIATGHYAKIKDGKLVKPLDEWKDQTYFLAQVSKDKFAKVLFPLQDMVKPQVREIADKIKLLVAKKKDSTGICFIGERNFTEFLQNYIPAQPGAIVDITSGQTIGSHVGAMYFTIGKRSGIGLSGMSEPYHVVGHDLAHKIVYVAPRSQPQYLKSDKVVIHDVNWLSDLKWEQEWLDVKFRYKSTSVKCQIKWLTNNSLEVIYPDGFIAVTPGQQAVFYKEEYCLGGGVIDEVFLGGIKKAYLC